MTTYALLKWIHLLSAAISITGFVIRGALRIQGSALLRRRWVRIAPHVNDTILLASALALAATIGQYPFGADWLTAKLLALLLYIFLGLMVMRLAKSLGAQVAAYVAAIATFSYIALVARAHAPWPF